MDKLSLTETSDFHYLLELMLPLYDVPEYACLPELFSIIGHEKLLLLAKYAGGETIKIPTIDEINFSIECLEYYYKIYIKHDGDLRNVPHSHQPLVRKIKEIIDARNS